MKNRVAECFSQELITHCDDPDKRSLMSNAGLRLYKFLQVVVNKELTSLSVPALNEPGRRHGLSEARATTLVADLWASVSRECSTSLQRLEWLRGDLKAGHLNLTPCLGDLVQLTELTELLLHEFTVTDVHLTALAGALSKLRLVF